MLDSLLHLTRAGHRYTVRTMAVLGTLVEQPAINGVHEMSMHVGVSRSRITMICDLLVKHGLITREPSRTDGRLVVLRATKAGQKLWKAAHAAEHSMRRAA